MVNTIDMQEMRYLNLFEKITRVRTRFCLKYNNGLVFCVPKPFIPKAVGERAKNLRKMGEILNKKIKVVAIPSGLEDAEEFIAAIINPVTFNKFEIKDNQIIVAGGKNKAALIGRNKRRILEMQKIVKGFFGKEYRVV